MTKFSDSSGSTLPKSKSFMPGDGLHRHFQLVVAIAA
jgi:hypothetical protein